MKKPKLSELRSQLLKRESELRSDIGDQSSKIEKVVNNNLTRVTIVGVGAFAAYFVFKSFSSTGKNNSKKGSLKHKKDTSKITQKIITSALKAFIPYAIGKIKTKESEGKA